MKTFNFARKREPTEQWKMSIPASMIKQRRNRNAGSKQEGTITQTKVPKKKQSHNTNFLSLSSTKSHLEK